jgi:hypothetical protein
MADGPLAAGFRHIDEGNPGVATLLATMLCRHDLHAVADDDGVTATTGGIVIKISHRQIKAIVDRALDADGMTFSQAISAEVHLTVQMIIEAASTIDHALLDGTP